MQKLLQMIYIYMANYFSKILFILQKYFDREYESTMGLVFPVQISLLTMIRF